MKTDKRSNVLRIAIPILVIAAVLFIFFIKNGQTAQGEQEGQSTTSYPLEITSVDIDTVRGYGVPTVIDFGSDSCIPCKQMAPVLETLNAEFQGRAAVQFMDVWKYTDGVDDFPVQVIPTQFFFDADGKPFVPSKELSSEIPFNMYSNKDSGEHVFTVHQGGITEEQMRSVFAEMGIE